EDQLRPALAASARRPDQSAARADEIADDDNRAAANLAHHPVAGDHPGTSPLLHEAAFDRPAERVSECPPEGIGAMDTAFVGRYHRELDAFGLPAEMLDEQPARLEVLGPATE